jgi:hypothetical protein
VLWSLFLGESRSTCNHTSGHYWLQNFCYTPQIRYSLTVKSASDPQGIQQEISICLSGLSELYHTQNMINLGDRSLDLPPGGLEYRPPSAVRVAVELLIDQSV